MPSVTYLRQWGVVNRFDARGFSRSLRRAALAGIMLLSAAPPSFAQIPDSLWISMRGGSKPDADTYVLVSGVLGGLAGYRGLERRLMALGHRVVIVDPYLMSMDSTDVSFDALARRINTLLDARGVHNAKLVGHAHGGGVALRIASSYPSKVSELFLLNVGALAGNHSPVFSSSIRLATIVVHVPGGKSFVRRKIVAGIRENTGKSDWLDDAAAHAYTDVPLAHIGGVVDMAMRLGKSEEPEPLATVISRVKVPVTLLLGALTCPASPGTEEIAALKPLGALLHIVKIEGTCHFPHEEAPEVVMDYLVHRR